MNQIREVVTGRYRATGRTGTEYLIIETTQERRFQGLGGTWSEWKFAGLSYKTREGKPVNWVREGVFDIVWSDDQATVSDS